MAAILLIPEYSALHLTKFSDINFPSKLTFYFSTIDMLARHCMDVAVETGLDHWPNIYCGVAIFLLVPLDVYKRQGQDEETIIVFFGDHQPTNSVVEPVWKLNGKRNSTLTEEEVSLSLIHI